MNEFSKRKSVADARWCSDDVRTSIIQVTASMIHLKTRLGLSNRVVFQSCHACSARRASHDSVVITKKDKQAQNELKTKFLMVMTRRSHKTFLSAWKCLLLASPTRKETFFISSRAVTVHHVHIIFPHPPAFNCLINRLSLFCRLARPVSHASAISGTERNRLSSLKLFSCLILSTKITDNEERFLIKLLSIKQQIETLLANWFEAINNWVALSCVRKREGDNGSHDTSFHLPSPSDVIRGSVLIQVMPIRAHQIQMI